MSENQAVIGLEVHAQLETRSKIFCRCAASYGGAANSRVCPICLGLPGALPVPNREAVRLALRFALALGATIHRRSAWARKNYVYPDLPKGYQITQHERPIATGGRLRIEPPGGPPQDVTVSRVHLEEDAGKLVHEGFGELESGVDFNRCGVPLVEIVSAPSIAEPEHAQLYLERLRAVLRVTGVCRAEMEEGTLRCDANVSLHRPGEALGPRVEIKNLNSFRHVRRALEHEIRRQGAVLSAGRSVVQETRLWDEKASATRAMRAKEDAEDYRYFPEPDLPELIVDDELLASAAEAMPELPADRRDRFVVEHGLGEIEAHRLTLEHELADYYEAVLASADGAARDAANWVLGEVQRCLGERGIRAPECPVAPDALGELMRLVAAERLSLTAARQVFRELEQGARGAAATAERLGLWLIGDDGQLRAHCEAALAEHPEQVASYRAGKTALHGFFVGQVMRDSDGRAHPEKVARILRELLDGRPA